MQKRNRAKPIFLSSQKLIDEAVLIGKSEFCVTLSSQLDNYSLKKRKHKRSLSLFEHLKMFALNLVFKVFM